MPAPTLISRDSLSALRAALDAARPPQISKREAVRAVEGSLRAARDRGCPDTQLLEILAAHGITITASTLRSYLSGATPKVRPPRKGAALAAKQSLDDAAPAISHAADRRSTGPANGDERWGSATDAV